MAIDHCPTPLCLEGFVQTFIKVLEWETVNHFLPKTFKSPFFIRRVDKGFALEAFVFRRGLIRAHQCPYCRGRVTWYRGDSPSLSIGFRTARLLRTKVSFRYLRYHTEIHCPKGLEGSNPSRGVFIFVIGNSFTKLLLNLFP